MKLSELQNEKDRMAEIERLREWRGEVAKALRHIDDGDVVSIYPVLCDADDDDFDGALPDLHRSSWPLLRQALDQTMLCIEAELIRLGVEVDEPALADDDGDAPVAGGQPKAQGESA